MYKAILLIFFLVLVPASHTHDTGRDSEASRLVEALRFNATLSSDQKILKYKTLIKKQSNKSIPNRHLLLNVNEAIMSDMIIVGRYGEVKKVSKQVNFSQAVQAIDENPNIYGKLVCCVAIAYVMLQELT